MKWIPFFLLISMPVMALDIVGAEELCNRFVTPTETEKCRKLIEEKKPDTYMSSLCRDIYDDQIFFQCLNFASQNSADPRRLATCQVENAPDGETMACLKRVAKRETSKFQRMPASIPTRKNPKNQSR